MMLTTGGVEEAMYGSLMMIQRGWSYRYQYRVIVALVSRRIEKLVRF